MNLTENQTKIITCAEDNSFIKINAFAGTGKTTVLEELTKSYNTKKFLYLVFNKSMADEAKKKFPHNTHVYTINGLAYKYSRYELNFTSIKNNYRVIEIKNYLTITKYDIALISLHIFNCFCNSAYKDINKKIILNLIDANDEMKLVFARNKSHIDDIVKNIVVLWNDMYNGKMEITHNFYLKYFHINIDRMKDFIKYDYVLLDEAQDTNDITLDIFNNLNGKKVLVGDKHQAIYGWRGAVNAMTKLKSDNVKNLYLTETFRFDRNIASKANFLLNDLLGEKESIISYYPDKANVINSHCCITRTNAGVIKVFSKNYDKGEVIKTVRNPDDIFKLPLSLYYFLNNKTKYRSKITVKWLYNFRSREDIKKYAQSINDVELLTSLNIVEEFWEDLITIYDNAKAFRRKKKVDLYVTTAHTCKGLEWDHVTIYNDFPNILQKIATITDDIDHFKSIVANIGDSNNSSAIQKIIEEINLYYVAVTRTIYKLDTDITNSDLFKLSKETINNLLTEYQEK
jgi:superfamily I DNA/RNA helicase